MMKLPEVSALVTIAVLSTKIWEVWNKIHSVSDLVKKMKYNGNIFDIKTKLFTNSGYNKLPSKIIETKIK